MCFTTRCARGHRDTEQGNRRRSSDSVPGLTAGTELRRCSFFLEDTERQDSSLVLSKPRTMGRMRAAGSTAARIRHISVIFFLRVSVPPVVPASADQPRLAIPGSAFGLFCLDNTRVCGAGPAASTRPIRYRFHCRSVPARSPPTAVPGSVVGRSIRPSGCLRRSRRTRSTR